MGEILTFTLVAPDGTMNATFGATDASGLATVQFPPLTEVGTYSVQATLGGIVTSAVSEFQVISNIAVSAQPTNGTAGVPVSLRAAVTTVPYGAPVTAAKLKVDFAITGPCGQAYAVSGTTDQTGTAIATFTPVTSGQYLMVATVEGTAAYGQAVSAPVSLTITGTQSPSAPVCLSLKPADGSIAAGGSQSFTAEGYDASGNDLGSETSATTFAISPDGGTGASSSGASCSGSSCTATAVGTYTVTGSDGSAQGTATLTVDKASQTIMWSKQGPYDYGQAPVTLNATASSGLPVSYSVVSGPCSVSGSTLAIYSGGSCVVEGSQDGNGMYVAATPVTETIVISYTETITGSHSGGLTVTGHQSVLIAPGASVSGPVSVQSGGAVDVESATITGPFDSSSAAAIRACDSKFTGPVTVTGTSGLVAIGDDEGPTCAGNNITGPVKIEENASGVEFDQNTVTGPLTITANTGTVPPPDTGTVVATGNTVTGPEKIQ